MPIALVKRNRDRKGSFSRLSGLIGSTQKKTRVATTKTVLEMGADDASRYAAETKVAMHSMQRLLELARHMDGAVSSSALLTNVELGNIEELTLKLEVYKVFLGISCIPADGLP